MGDIKKLKKVGIWAKNKPKAGFNLLIKKNGIIPGLV
jgi:hypothetical protein